MEALRGTESYVIMRESIFSPMDRWDYSIINDSVSVSLSDGGLIS